MKLRELTNLAKSVPVRVRVSVALVLLEVLSERVAHALAGTVHVLVELGWHWVSGESKVLEAMYEVFNTLVEEALASPPSDMEVARAAARGAYCLIWEAYSLAYDAGDIGIDDLPAEVTEGDPSLWGEFAECLPESGLAVPLALEFLASVRRSYAGPADDSRVIPSREALRDLWNRNLP